MAELRTGTRKARAFGLRTAMIQPSHGLSNSLSQRAVLSSKLFVSSPDRVAIANYRLCTGPDIVRPRPGLGSSESHLLDEGRRLGDGSAARLDRAWIL